MIEIEVNGEHRRIPSGTSLAGLVDELGLRGRRIAIEVNREIVPKDRYDDFPLSPGDRVEIVHAIGGGQ